MPGPRPDGHNMGPNSGGPSRLWTCPRDGSGVSFLIAEPALGGGVTAASTIIGSSAMVTL